MNKKENSYLKAEKRVRELKNFYNNLFAFILFLILWILFYNTITDFVLSRVKGADQGFRNWLNVNLWLVPSIWGLILIIHGIYAHSNRFNFFRNWEHKKLEEFMNEDQDLNSTNKWE